ncbi:MAG: twin-arginine translocation signal domain-containing protein, partial [Planctomycetota bacterium]
MENSKVTDTGRITRRQFLGRTAALSGLVALPWIVSSSARGSEGNVAPSERITIGCVGLGNQGSGLLRGFLGKPDVQIVAVCDVHATK